jgi:hypothetical protein
MGVVHYFMSRRKWFFGLLAATFLLDLIDTRLKGGSYFHAVFVACALVYLVIWMFQRYLILS